MSPSKMLSHCREQMRLRGQDAEAVFMLPGKWGKRDTRRLCPGGPIGKIVMDNFGDGLAVMFRANDVVKFLETVKEET